MFDKSTLFLNKIKNFRFFAIHFILTIFNNYYETKKEHGLVFFF